MSRHYSMGRAVIWIPQFTANKRLSVTTLSALINERKKSLSQSHFWHLSRKEKERKCALREKPHHKQKGNQSGRACTAAPYLSLSLAPDFTAGMQRWNQSLSVFNEHGMVTVWKTTRPRNRGLGCSNRYGKISTKTFLFSSYLTVKWTQQTCKLSSLRMLAATFREPFICCITSSDFHDQLSGCIWFQCWSFQFVCLFFLCRQLQFSHSTIRS